MTMETLTRDVPSSMHHHNNSSVLNMKHSYVQVYMMTIVYLDDILMCALVSYVYC